jgi:L-fuconolactonase
MSLVIDAHQHVWDLDRSEYAWLTPALNPLDRTFTEEELVPQLAACGVDRTVLVQAEDSTVDTDLMLETADRHADVVAGVVGWVPLERPHEAEIELERRIADPRFCGVRHLIHDDPDPDWLRRPAVLDGLRLLAGRGVPFDVVAVLPRHLEHVPFLVEHVPGLRLVIDHLAKPPIAERGWEPWARLIRRAAESPAVYAKVSGLNTAADPASWTADHLRPYVEHALDCFGPARLMFGGDWPVALLAGDYAKVVRQTRRLLEPLGEAERDRVLGGTAVEAYGLRVEAPR